MDTAERFWAKVDKSNGCWLWRAARNRGGYGIFENGRRTLYAHRYALELNGTPVPDGLFALHRCDNPPCVRPDHLFVGSLADNVADMVQKGRQARVALTPDRLKRLLAAAADWRNQHPERLPTHCVRGHEYSPENVRLKTDGSRQCVTCTRIRVRDSCRRQRAAETPERRARRQSQQREYLARKRAARIA